MRLRHTKIIFTIGPATESEERIEALIREGADICRINMAHANHEWTETVIRRVRAVSKKVGREIAILMDVKGPEIRTGDVGEEIQLERGELFDFLVTPEAAEEGIRSVTVNYPGIIEDITVGDTILVDSGLIRLEAKEISTERIRAEVLIPGPLGNRRHINLPGVHVKLPSLTEKDEADINVGVREGIDFFALSFVREAQDLHALRNYLRENDSPARIVAKIEDQSGIRNLEEIIQACDALMVARGDLGIEVPYEELPLLQHQAVVACQKEGRPVIIATHMLETMIDAPMPSRAEITDISSAIVERADAIMLSGETSVGKYPIECVRVMKRIADRIEPEVEKPFNPFIQLKTTKAKLLRSALSLAVEMNKGAVVVFTRSGFLPAVLAALRARSVPIYAFTDEHSLFRQLVLYWGVEPFYMEFSENFEETILDSIDYLKRREWVEDGQELVVITNVLIGGDKVVDALQIRQV